MFIWTIVHLVLGALTLQGAPIAFDSSRAWEHLRQMVSIGPRPAGSPAIEQTRKYIKDQLAKDGIAVVDQTWEATTPNGTVRMVNLIATIPASASATIPPASANATARKGASQDRIVITGHYDTKRIREFRFVGASDGASSAAFLLELANVLKARRNPLAYELVFLDGEEAVCREWDECSRPNAPDNTYGSRHYVAEAKKSATLASAKAMILVDMIADRNLTLRRELNSTAWLTDIIWTAAAKLGHTPFMAETTRVEDDHLPFLDAGVPSVDIIDLDYPQWHTAADTLDAVSARSLQIVGDTLVAALPQIEARLAR